MSSEATAAYLRELAKERLKAFDLFSSADYLAIHPDVAAARVDPYDHAIERGVKEGRPLFSTPQIVKKLSKVQPAASPTSHSALGELAHISVNVLVSELGSILTNEIANLLVDDFRSLGVKADIVHESAVSKGVDPRSCVVVAPHEFFVLGSVPMWLTEEFTTQCVVLNVEQVQAPKFAAGLVPMLLARGIIDLCPQMATVWRAMGKPSIHYEPSVQPCEEDQLWAQDIDHPLIEALPPAARKFRRQPVTERPLDLCFVGARSTRRDGLFARYAGRFSAYASFIYFCQRLPTPMRSNSSEGALGRVANHVASVSKLCLNIHRDDSPCFEWHRMVKHGMASGAVVVSDSCLPHPLYKANENFLQEEARHLPNIVDWVLNTPDGRAVAEKIAANNLELLRDRNRRRARVMALLNFITESRARADVEF